MESEPAIERHIRVKDSDTTAVELLATHTGLSKSRIKDAMSKGAVWVIETGRKHQIRKHLSAIGYPVAGDRQYGSDDRSGIQLAATSLGFRCPVSGNPVTYELPAALHPKTQSGSGYPRRPRSR